MFTAAHNDALSAVLVVVVAGVAATTLHARTRAATIRHLQRLHLVRTAVFVGLLIAPWAMVLGGVTGFNAAMATTNVPAGLYQSAIWAMAAAAVIAGAVHTHRRTHATQPTAPPAS